MPRRELRNIHVDMLYFCRSDALLRLATAVLVEIDEEWATSDRIYINWDNSDT